jgi:hypothetical protein
VTASTAPPTRPPRPSRLKAITPYQRGLLTEVIHALSDAHGAMQQLPPATRQWGDEAITARLESLAEVLAEDSPFRDRATCLKHERNLTRDLVRDARRRAGERP